MVTIENKKASQAIKLLKWERDTAQRQLQIAESAIRYHENKYETDIACWKAKDKASRKRAWEAAQVGIQQAKRINGFLDPVNALEQESLTIAELAEKEKE